MDPIIRAAALASHPRRLRAPGTPHLVAPRAAGALEEAAAAQPEPLPASAAATVAGPAVAAAEAAAAQHAAALAQAVAAERARVLAEVEAGQQAWIAGAEQAQRDWLAQAEAQRGAWREQAEQELRAAYGEAERRGLEAGTAQAQQVAEELVQAQVARLQAAAATLLQAQSTLGPALEDDAVELAFTMVCRLLGEQAASRAGIGAMLQVQLATLRERRALTVHLHPADCALMAAAEGEGDAALRYVPDAGVALGGCLIDSAAGTLDARLEYQLEQLRRALLQARGAA
jgi:flagellar assembly protein FliH